MTLEKCNVFLAKKRKRGNSGNFKKNILKLQNFMNKNIPACLLLIKSSRIILVKVMLYMHLIILIFVTTILTLITYIT